MTLHGYVRLPNRGVLAIGGEDAQSFLQGLVTNDVAAVTAERGGYGALLTPQGKFLFDFLLYRTADGFLMETEADRLPDLMRRLAMYKLRAKVTIADVSDRYAVLALLPSDGGLPDRTPALSDGAILVTDPRLGELGGRVLLPPDQVADAMAELGLAEQPVDAWESHRMALGVPDGSRDIEIEKGILLENGFEELGGVAFDKGCFIGQELTARTKYRGLVKKRLLPIVITGDAPAPGTIVRLGEREAGEMRTSAAGCGLALLRLDQLAKAEASGEPLMAGEARIAPQPAAWMRFELPAPKV